jgi:hypothetical protein
MRTIASTVRTQPDGSPIFLILYMDDMLLSGRYIGELPELRRLKFTMKDLGPVSRKYDEDT